MGLAHRASVLAGSAGRLSGRRGGWVITIARTATRAVSHGVATKAHAANEGSGGGGSGAIIIFNGILVDGLGAVGVGGHASPTNAKGRGAAWGGAREADGRD